MPVFHTIAALRAALKPLRDGGIAMVPTMGALHAGHVSLVTQAKNHAATVVVSIFVNPTQFAPGEDFDAYPRTLEADIAKLPADTIVFAPSAREMYPDGYATTVSVGGPSQGLESDFRPHFFAGVATVVSKLLIAAAPDVAMFGEKDYQQLLVVHHMVRDLGLPVTIMPVPTMRETDGLAMSSRNAYLSAQDRTVAAQMNLILQDAIVAVRSHGDMARAQKDASDALLKAGFAQVDYVAIRDAQTLAPITTLERPARILAAAKIGKTRLIDNMAISKQA